MLGLAKLSDEPGHVGLVERRQPRRPGPGQALLDVVGAGICGTDLHIAAGEYACRPPVTMGHEVCATVVEVGSEVDESWRGKRVVCETYFSTCDRCRWCRDGRSNLCPERRSIGTHVDGAFAPQLIVPARNLHPAPAGLSDSEATLIEPLACITHALLDPSVVAPGDRVLVVGPGPIGLLAAQVARTLGGDVWVSGLTRDSSRLDLAERLGLEVAREGEATGEFDVVLEASGSAAGATAALNATYRGGRYVQIGIFGSLVTVPLDRILEKELQVTATFASTPTSWRRALDLVKHARLQLEPLVSAVVPLNRWEEAFADLREGRATKIVFDPRL